MASAVSQASSQCQPRHLRRVFICVAITTLILAWLRMGFPSSIEKPLQSPSARPSNSIQTGQFPRKIWQQWASHPPSFAEQEMERVKSWTEANPEWRWEVLTDATALGYVESHFGPHALNRPDIVEFFKKIELRIIKADLLRYLVMYVEGGLYADIDVEALKPIREFIPDGFDEGDIDVVIGVETDEPDFKDHPILGGLSRSFVQWTFLCKPKLPIMMRIVESLMTNIQQLVKEQGVPLFEVKLDFYQIIGNSGPGLFTSLIMQHMQEISNQKEPITWDTFHHLDQPKLASRVLVLPVKAFAACQTHSRSGKTHKIPEALIKHHYGASNWTDWHPRYKHPVYGFVEDCLFNTTCVRQWEKNVKVYKGHKFS